MLRLGDNVPVLIAGQLILLLVGCSSQQLYRSGQAWQQNECRKLPPAEQQRCLASNAMSFEQYQKEAASLKGS
jgi:hypothetical protein